uniref:F-box domain-containing protein n=1 Tax=Amphimedon queenslandica TaxID=400682 RepID=A0A1X7VDG2_AMPQE
MAEAEPCCKRLKLDISFLDDESDDDFYHSESPIDQSTANHLPLIEDEDYINPFDSLPNEVIQEICMFLSLRDKMSLRLVNRRLYMICSDPFLWRNVVIDDAYHKTNAPFIKSALQTCRPHVQSLSLRGLLPFSAYQQMILTWVQQGDPLGPLAFSILLHPIIERVQREVPGLLLNAWYLDDGILTGPPADLLSALNIIEDMGPPCGLHLNHSKSLLFLPSGVDSSQSSLPSDIPVTSLGFVLLGSPIGPPEFCCESISKRLDKAKESVKLLSLLEDSQFEYSLLRSCLSLQKISCALRTTTPDILVSVIQDFDNFMFHCISDLGVLGSALPMPILELHSFPQFIPARR